MAKRGQSALNAAVLVALIFGLIILYIMAIPSKDREKLLTGNGGTTSTTSSTTGNITLLKTAVGTIEDIDLKEVEHSIPSINLLRTTGAKVLKKANPFQVRNGIFDFQAKQVKFSVDEADTNNVLLSFSVPNAKGILTVKLNGEAIFEGYPESSSILPLAKEDLQNDNTLEFAVSGVGWKFWTTNLYQISDLMVTADITDRSREKSKTTFFVSRKEFDNLESASLRFNPDCNPADVGLLDIKLNGRQLYSSIPDCATLNKFEFDSGLLDIGENTLDFTTTKGSYLIDQILVKTKLAKEVFPIFYFEVNSSNFRDITNKSLEAVVHLEFVDDDATKRLDLNINGHRTNVDQEKPTYSRKITSWIEEGNNYVEVIPKTRVNVVELKIYLEESG